MIDFILTPLVGLKQSVDFPLDLLFAADRGIQATDHARMHLRYSLTDPDVIDSLDTDNGRITITILGDGRARVVSQLSGEASALYPVTTAEGESRYRKLKASEAPTALNPEAYTVLPVYGTLIVSSVAGADRVGTALDCLLLFEASYVRGT